MKITEDSFFNAEYLEATRIFNQRLNAAIINKIPPFKINKKDIEFKFPNEKKENNMNEELKKINDLLNELQESHRRLQHALLGQEDIDSCDPLSHLKKIPSTPPQPISPPEKIKRKLAPALSFKGGYWLSHGIYSSEKDARQMLGEEFYCWPAPLIGPDGFYEIEQEENKNETNKK